MEKGGLNKQLEVYMTEKIKLNTIEEAIEDFRNGKIKVILNDLNTFRPDEGIYGLFLILSLIEHYFCEAKFADFTDDFDLMTHNKLVALAEANTRVIGRLYWLFRRQDFTDDKEAAFETSVAWSQIESNTYMILGEDLPGPFYRFFDWFNL